MSYRQRKGSDTWHFHRACRWWPKKAGTFIEKAAKPKGEFCNECLAKRRRKVQG